MSVQVFLMLIAILLTSALSLISDSSEWHTEATLPEAFISGHVFWAHYIISVVTVIALCPLLLSNVKDAWQMLEAMAKDGLLCRFCSQRNARSNTCIWNVLFVNFCASALALLLPVGILIQTFGYAVLVLNVLVGCVSISFHYKPEESSSNRRRERRDVRRKIKRRQRRRLASLGRNNNELGVPVRDDSVRYGATGSVLLVPVEQTMPEVTLDSSENGRLPGSRQDDSNPDSSARTGSSPDAQSSSDTDIDDIVEEYHEILRERAQAETESTLNLHKPPSSQSYLRVRVSVCGFLLSALVMALILLHADSLVRQGNVAVVVTLVASLITGTAASIVIARQPRTPIYPFTAPIRVPCVPWIPMAAILLCVHLALSLSWIAFLLMFVWGLAGNTS